MHPRNSDCSCSAPARTVLVADDDTQVRTALRARLQSWGYKVMESRDGLGAIAKALTASVDVIVLDDQMPLGEGRAIAASLRRSTSAPIIFLSGRSAEEFRDTILQVPDSYYLSKPLDSGRLCDLLASLSEPVCA